MTTSMKDLAKEYFSSMSTLASKFLQDCETVSNAYGNDWNELDVDRQEQLINDYIIRPEIVDQYSSVCKDNENLPNCFPVLKINSGEKVIVDFEHEDGWTWTDEHSAPFSWRSRSQQDLTLAEIFEATSETSDGRSRVHSATNASVSTDDDRNEVQRMFEKFGIKVESDFVEEGSDLSSSIGGNFTDSHVDVEHQVFDSSAGVHVSSARLEEEDKETAEELKGDRDDEGTDGDTSYHPVNDSERTGSTSADGMNNEEMDGGIFIELPGESTTDELVHDGNSVSSRESKNSEVVITTQPCSVNSNVQDNSGAQMTLDTDALEVVKTGFDFLDNW